MLLGLDAVTGAEELPRWLPINAAPDDRTMQFECLALLRVLPGRRLVIRASLDGEPVVLKLFMGESRERHLARERRGLEWLQEAGVPAPGILQQVGAEGVAGLVLRYLPGAQPVAADDQAAVERVAGLLARMHAAGVWQEDLHLANFLSSEGRVFAIDGDGVRRRSRRLPARAGLQNLAQLAAQRSPMQDAGHAGLLAAYYGAEHGAASATNFARQLARARRRRIRRYLAKTQRSCSEFVVAGDWRSRTFALRGAGEAALQRLGAEPERVFDGAQMLKAGNSATVVRTNGPDPLVVKRYNIKNLSQRVRRMLRPLPRYRRAWMTGRLLHFLELPAARPLALVEHGRGPWRGVAYLVMEDLGDRSLLAEIESQGLSDQRLAEITALFSALRSLGLQHGDTKAANFVIQDDRVHLIDLDAMRWTGSGSTSDVTRFLDNWPPPERSRFEASFRLAGLL